MTDYHLHQLRIGDYVFVHCPCGAVGNVAMTTGMPRAHKCTSCGKVVLIPDQVLTVEDD